MRWNERPRFSFQYPFQDLLRHPWKRRYNPAPYYFVICVNCYLLLSFFFLTTSNHSTEPPILMCHLAVASAFRVHKNFSNILTAFRLTTFISKQKPLYSNKLKTHSFYVPSYFKNGTKMAVAQGGIVHGSAHPMGLHLPYIYCLYCWLLNGTYQRPRLYSQIKDLPPNKSS